MEEDEIWHPADANTGDLPTHDGIVLLCREANFLRNGVCVQVAGNPRFWVKYSDRSLIRSEGRTQAYVANIVNNNPASVFHIPNVHLGFSRGTRGYIAMDFVQGTTIAQRKALKGGYLVDDKIAVAAAIQQLISIKVPATTAPGPVGGGRIRHMLFN
ncbi:hypothetical protein BD626DRAFT_26966 [Schizophyllum amplum]|uniref:Protein kinase domain-containing protein n=1 Tax=Schizophyllum amplum TaxID=97359 RepID=A0A550CZS8_9AGAR|nr:hypothetical protein BD626DRAFT_26966 [Auriculariopsis ampla]